MSDTPKTDELAKRDFVPDGLWIRHARELERENAALREQLDAARKHSALVVTFLAQAQVELVETRHHLNKSKETQP